MEEQQQEIFTLQEAAEYLRVTKVTMRKLVAEGVIPARKVGREWRIHKDALVEWLKKEK